LSITVLPPSLEIDRRSARLRSGGGCIRCGCTIYSYCALTEAPEDVFLLCPPCRNQLAKAEGRDMVVANLQRNPVATQRELNRDAFAYTAGSPVPSLMFPDGTRMRGIPYPIIFDHQPVLAMLDPERGGRAYRISVKLGLPGMSPQTLVDANEWVADEAEWSFTRLNNRYAIASRWSEVALSFRVLASETLAIDALRTWSVLRLLLIDGSGIQVDGNPIPAVGSRGQLRGMTL
jgi:hypothetical protein